jgi:hypothetical protein
VTVQELIDKLERMPPQAMLVFDDQAEDPHSYDDVEIEFNLNGEVVIRTV